MASVVVLSEDLARRMGNDLELMDRALREEFGLAYSHKSWKVENFLRFMPDKWRLSQILFIEKRVAGFWIASRRGDNLHTHRVGVSLRYQNQGYGSLLYKSVLQLGKDAKLKKMTLTVSINNSVAMRFYESLGFVRQDSAQILKFLNEQGRDAAVQEDRLLEGGEFPYYLYLKIIL